MCEHCEMELQEEQEIESTPLSPIQSQVEQVIFCEPLLISTDNLAEDIEYDEEEFNRGLKDSSYIAGLFTGLINSGMDLESATTFVLNTQNIKMNIDIAGIQSNSQIEVSKNQSIMIEKNQL